MKEAVIIGNGSFPRTAWPRELLRRAAVIVCCDGAFKTFLQHRDKIFTNKRNPDIVIGDMDSLSPSLLKEYASICVHVSEQDDNDQTKAVHYVQEHFPDVNAIHLLAATGKREDHTIGNMSLLMEYARETGACGNPAGRAQYVDMVSDNSTIFALTDSASLFVGEGRRVSLFSPDNSLKIKSSGLQWPTDNVVFDNWWKATLNRATSDEIRLEFSHKSIALIALN